jgi:hypothetical protein
MSRENMPTPIHSKRFDIDTEKNEMLEYLRIYGYVVIKEVANEEERNIGISLMVTTYYSFFLIL